MAARAGAKATGLSPRMGTPCEGTVFDCDSNPKSFSLLQDSAQGGCSEGRPSPSACGVAAAQRSSGGAPGAEGGGRSARAGARGGARAAHVDPRPAGAGQPGRRPISAARAGPAPPRGHARGLGPALLAARRPGRGAPASRRPRVGARGFSRGSFGRVFGEARPLPSQEPAEVMGRSWGAGGPRGAGSGARWAPRPGRAPLAAGRGRGPGRRGCGAFGSRAPFRSRGDQPSLGPMQT